MEIEKDNILFRADVDYRELVCWYDTVMVDWESSNHLIPAEILMFFQFENEEQIYAVIHSCHEKFRDYSVLSNVWIKEYEKDTPSSISKILPYEDKDTCKDRTPQLRIIPCEAIHSHCLLMPLAESSQQVIQIKCSSTWADKFFPIK